MANDRGFSPVVIVLLVIAGVLMISFLVGMFSGINPNKAIEQAQQDSSK